MPGGYRSTVWRSHWQRGERAPFAQMYRQHVLQAGADEEELLLEAQLLALRCGIVRVQDPGQVFGVDLLAHGLVVIARVERLNVERRNGASGPEPQVIDGGAAVTRNQPIEADGVNILGADPAMRFSHLRARRRLAAAAEVHDVAHVAARGLPDIAQSQPAARDFPLAAVTAHDLGKNAVVVANAVADGRVLERGQRIQEARGQAPQSAVAKTRVDLLGGNVVEFVPHAAQSDARL